MKTKEQLQSEMDEWVMYLRAARERRVPDHDCFINEHEGYCPVEEKYQEALKEIELMDNFYESNSTH